MRDNTLKPRVRHRLNFLVLIMVIGCHVPQATGNAQRTTTWTGLDVGPYPVGHSVLFDRDMTRRSFASDAEVARREGRPMQIVIWYPAAATTASRVSLRSYIELSAGVLGPDSATPQLRTRAVADFTAQPLSTGVSQSTMDSVLQLGMQAAADAPHWAGRFPLLILLHASPWGGSVMSEYLASHGFVVAAIESKGALEAEYRLSRENLDAMVQDAMFVVVRMRKESYVAQQLGIIGMSNGAIAALALQLRGIIPDAVVSLDGGIGERAGGTYLNERADSVPARFTAPLLHLYTPDNPNLNLQYIHSYDAAPRMLVRVGHLRHSDFLTGGALERVYPGLFGSAPANASLGFELVSRYTYNFLRWHLMHDEPANRFLLAPPEANEPLHGLLAIERLPSRR